jgi:SAM-dependent methyltransferase
MSDPSTLHAEQLAFWNGPAVTRWITKQEQMDGALGPVADATVELARAQTGERVLDIGCGSGATSMTLARLVGLGGHVTGVDVSAPMIELARRRSAGMANLDWLLVDAATHGFEPRSIDLLFSRFGVMFFGDPIPAFVNLRRAMRPEGRVVFACWRPMGENPWMLVPFQAVQPLVPPAPKPGSHDPGPFAFADPQWVSHILTQAGFTPPRFQPFDFPMPLGSNLDEAVEQATSMGAAARALREQPDATLQAARTAVRTALAPHERAGAVALPGAVWLVESRLAG